MVWPTPVMTGTRLVFAAVSTLYLALAIPLEERTLRRQFGPVYAAYAARVTLEDDSGDLLISLISPPT